MGGASPAVPARAARPGPGSRHRGGRGVDRLTGARRDATGWSRLYQTALLGPLAEQLIDAAAIEPGMRVVELLGGAGVLTRRLAATVGPTGSVVAVVDSDDDARSLGEEVGEFATTTRVVVAATDPLPFDDREFDAAVSLLRLAGRVGGTALDEMARVADQAAAVVTGGVRPLPEDLFATAWQDVIGDLPPELGSPPAVLAHTGWTATPMGDVVRFNSPAQLWLSLCHHLALEVPHDHADAVSRRFYEGVAAFQSADGTLRIPIEVTLLRTVRA